MNSQSQSKSNRDDGQGGTVPVPDVLEKMDIATVKQEPMEDDDLEVVKEDYGGDPFHPSHHVPTLTKHKDQLLSIARTSDAELRATKHYMAELGRATEDFVRTGRFIKPTLPPCNSIITPELMQFSLTMESKLDQLAKNMASFMEATRARENSATSHLMLLQFQMYENTIRSWQQEQARAGSSSSTLPVPEVIAFTTPAGPSPSLVQQRQEQVSRPRHANVDMPAPRIGESSSSCSKGDVGSGSTPSATTAQAQKHFQVPSSPGVGNRFWCKCGRSYAHKGSLTDHVLSQTKGKIFKCQYCDKKYMSNQSLKGHAKIKHGLVYNKFGCRQCGATFANGNLLSNHRRISHPT